MTVRLLPAILTLVAMIGAPALGHVLRPTVRIADQGPKIDLEAMIPKQFGEWQELPQQNAQIVNPQQQEKLDKLYAQLLNRVYVDESGYRIMLSIAYGNDQSSEGTQVHRPEFCYTSQGFQLLKNVAGNLPTKFGTLPARRLVAVQGTRHELITYWITVGDTATLPGLGRKIQQLSFGLTGKVPDGLLFRVSSIDADDNVAYAMQDKFINELLDAAGADARRRLGGIAPNQ